MSKTAIALVALVVALVAFAPAQAAAPPAKRIAQLERQVASLKRTVQRLQSEKVVLRSQRDDARALVLEQIQATVPQAIATMLPRDLFAIVFPAAKARLDKYLPRSRGGCSDASIHQSGSYVTYTFRSSCP